MNYNLEKPKEPPKKYFNYQNIFIISFVLALVYIFSTYFVQDAVIYKIFAEERMIIEPDFNYSGIIKSLGSPFFASFIDMLGRASIPLFIFCIFLTIKNRAFKILPVTTVIVFMEVFYHYFHFGGIRLKYLSDLSMMLFSILFFYSWLYVEGKERAWLIRLLMALLLIISSTYLGIKNSITLSLFIMSIAFFEPVRLNQAVFGALSLFALGLPMISNIFIYFYDDEEFIRKKTNIYLIFILPIVAVIIFLLRNKFLG